MQQITKNVYQISLGATNCFVVDGDGLTLIDTGYKGSDEKIFNAIKKAGRSPNEIKRIILTHCHPDHTGSAASIKQTLGVTVFAHSIDADLIEQGIGGRLPLHRTPGFINWLVFNIFIKPNGNEIEPVHVNQRVSENDIIPAAGGIQVIHTPGHSAGHICLLIKNEGVLIAADLCSNVTGLAESTVNEDRALAMQSILKAANYDFDKAVFGHGKVLAKDASKKLKKKFA